MTMAGTALAVAGTAHITWNQRRLRTPPTAPPPVDEPVAVLVPVRNEAERVEPCLRSVLAQTGVRDLRVLVLDDESSDDTADVVRRVAGQDARLRLISGEPVPAGWWGKTWACHQLATEACATKAPREVGGSRIPTVLVFVDADVILAPHAVAAAVAVLRESGLDLVSPFPRQGAGTAAERLVQPLLQWSWLTTMPLRLAETSPRPTLAAANGQFLVVDTGAYGRAGGHAGVRAQMVEDVALLRALKRSGGRGVVVDGTALATCRMYDGWASLRDGYAKSLWSAFGSPAGAVAVAGGLALAYVVPALAAVRGSRVGLVGYGAGVAGRALAARRTGSPVWPDSLAHPASIVAFGWLVATSVRQHRAGTLTTRGRPLP